MTGDIDSKTKDYQALLEENKRLRKEIEKLRQQLGIEDNGLEDTTEQLEIFTSISELPQEKAVHSSITQNSTSLEKIQLFLSLFKGRDDVFARRWENKKKETSVFLLFSYK